MRNLEARTGLRQARFMESGAKTRIAEQVARAKARPLVDLHLQGIESNPLDAADVAMFETFERKGWPRERRRAYILDRAGPLR